MSAEASTNKIVCKCGHPAFLHIDNGTCSQLQCKCWEFEPQEGHNTTKQNQTEQSKPFTTDTQSQPIKSATDRKVKVRKAQRQQQQQRRSRPNVEDAVRRTQSEMEEKTRDKNKSVKQSTNLLVSNSLLTSDDEQKFAPYFADANKQIDELESQANGKKSQIDSDLLKSKIEIVKDLAQKIEKAGFPIERIANEIVHQLKGKVSPTHIRDNIDDKYKDSRQSKNAKGKKRNQKVATVVLPTNPPQEIVLTEGGGTEPLKEDIPGGHEETSASAQPVVHPVVVTQPQSQEQESAPAKSQVATVKDIQSQSQPEPQEQAAVKASQQDFRVLIDWDELQDKIADVHHKDIKNFWLCGRIENGTKKLLDMVLEREQSQMVVT